MKRRHPKEDHATSFPAAAFIAPITDEISAMRQIAGSVWSKRLAATHHRPAVLLLVMLASAIAVSAPFLYHALLDNDLASVDNNNIAPSISFLEEGQRRLSLDLGNGNCKWQPPTYDVPENIDFHKTLIAGFPSGDKRMIFVQMEALTGWPAKDEWDFEYLGMSNHPFIKANYPHHEGIWGWQDAADQVVLMVRNIRRSMVEYHDILWDIGYAKTWEEATMLLDQLYGERPPIEDFFVWRDWRVMEEVHWYGWFIDYWMEGGLMRDMFTHKITTAEHWNMLMMPTVYSRDELDYDLVVGPDTVVTPTYDPHCANGEVTDGCEPIAVISAENLRDYTKGPAETALIAAALTTDERMGKYVIKERAWHCIWEELIPRGKGLKTVYDRPGYKESDYNFSAEMLEEMIHELDRLITKYGSAEWNTKTTANKVVALLVEHRALIQAELNEVNSGVRKLTDNDFLGPKERERRRILKVQEEEKNGKEASVSLSSSDAAAESSGRKLKVQSKEQREHSNYYFNTLEKLLEKNRLLEKKRSRCAQKRREMRQRTRRANRRTREAAAQ